ncbi:MAG: hypothetical protein KJ556_11155 [Gammaproteobacteria bacterium]|nr:hypothetical protein [Gammaproteobacteria bacterium]MBU2056139.1 hypothetical protein [Gammaproteobacteria bacterium]MBU2175675.1 hypothetical protein [Gammaproteobacteria bacterium]MBU2245382.1 hypothetical protein [Gammaproteobacteria bacterium]MBU2345773.1 hypothetical protein [Gammaproteobacteria bacterium]
MIGVILTDSLSSDEDIVDLVKKVYTADLNGRIAPEQRMLETEIHSHDQFHLWNSIVPKAKLKAAFDKYRNEYRDFKADDFAELNNVIVKTGIVLPIGQLLFHGRGDKLTSFERPVSSSLFPQIAVWHARKHRSHELTGVPIYIYAFKILGTGVTSCIDFGDSEFGHEYEILIQADICIHEKKNVELGGDVFLIQCELKSATTF